MGVYIYADNYTDTQKKFEHTINEVDKYSRVALINKSLDIVVLRSI